MPLVEIIRRASNYILGGGDSAPDTDNFNGKMSHQYEDNEVLYCKNNVCVHPPAIARQDTDILHHPGYLTISTKVFVDQYNESRRPTLFLTWIPNATLTKCPSSSAVLQNLKISNNHQQQKQISLEEPYFTPKNEDKDFSNDSSSLVQSMDERRRPLLHIDLKRSTNPFLNCDLSSSAEISKDDSLGNSSEDSSSISSSDNKQATTTTLININVDIANPDIEIVSTPEDGVVCDGLQSIKENSITEKCDFSRSESVTSSSDDQLSQQSYNNGACWMSTTPEFLAQKHNLTFPQENGNGSNSSSPIPITKKQHNNNNNNHIHKCRRFSVDLSQMRSLRLFFNDSTCTCGQLVVASRESQYKILHFHHGGLDRLAQVLHQWHSLLHNIKHAKGYEDNLPYRHFMVCRPEVSDLELHPEEGQVPKLTEQMFGALFNDSGQLEDDLALRKSIFFSGMERSLRKEVWPFLLHVYPYQSTYAERSQLVEIRRQEYEEVTRRRLDMTGAQLAHFRRKIQGVVEKDVVRTDRGNPYFTGDDNPNLEVMKNVLLNYAVYNPGLGYTQGMSDLLAPVLCELKDEVAAFWCFVGLMQRAVFVATPTDRDMDRSLRYLRELVRLMVPHFHLHLEKHKDAAELLFCHRWILLCFKREFTEGVALRMWEACWANYLTDYFHLFLCLAIICVYADDVIAQDLRADEMLLHFSSLAMYMDGQLIARKARGLLHQFRQLREIPCTLSDLCAKCGPGIWDSSHSPRIYCVAGGANHHDNTTTTSSGYYCNNHCIPSN